MPQQQNAELIHARADLVANDPPSFLQLPILAREFVQREHRVVAWMIGVVDRRPIRDLAIVRSQREMVRNRDRFAMRDQESVIRAFERRPAANARCGAGTIEKYGHVASEAVTCGMGGKEAFMAAPSHFARLHGFTDESVDRPGVDELATLLALGTHLRLALD